MLSEIIGINKVLDSGTGETVLTKAVEDDDPELIKALLAHGANINGEGIRGSPLATAASRLDEEMIQFLLDLGADPMDQDGDGNTPLHFAVHPLEDFDFDTESMQLLLNNGADILAVNKQGQTPLHKAVQGWRNFEAVKLLIDLGTPVNVQDYQGNTPLHYANTYFKHHDPYGDYHSISYPIDTIKFLIDHGADRTIRNNAGKTPAQMENITVTSDLINTYRS